MTEFPDESNGTINIDARGSSVTPEMLMAAVKRGMQQAVGMAPQIKEKCVTVKFEGVPIKLGDATYIVPPLSTGAMRRMQADIDDIGKGDSGVAEQVRCTRIVHAALLRNYPDLTIEAVEDLVDARNVKELLGAVFGQSGVTPAGEAPAPQPSAESQSTGRPSMLS